MRRSGVEHLRNAGSVTFPFVLMSVSIGVFTNRGLNLKIGRDIIKAANRSLEAEKYEKQTVQ